MLKCYTLSAMVGQCYGKGLTHTHKKKSVLALSSKPCYYITDTLPANAAVDHAQHVREWISLCGVKDHHYIFLKRAQPYQSSRVYPGPLGVNGRK